MESWLLLIYSALTVFWVKVAIDPLPVLMTLIALLTFFWIIKQA